MTNSSTSFNMLAGRGPRIWVLAALGFAVIAALAAGTFYLSGVVPGWLNARALASREKDMRAAEVAVRADYEQWIRDYNAHKPGLVAQHYTDDAEIALRADNCPNLHGYPPSGCQRHVVGKQAITDLFLSVLFDDPNAAIRSDLGAGDVYVNRDSHKASIKTYITVTSTDANTGKVVTEKHEIEVIYSQVKNARGAWRRSFEAFDL